MKKTNKQHLSHLHSLYELKRRTESNTLFTCRWNQISRITYYKIINMYKMLIVNGSTYLLIVTVPHNHWLHFASYSTLYLCVIILRNKIKTEYLIVLFVFECLLFPHLYSYHFHFINKKKKKSKSKIQKNSQYIPNGVLFFRSMIWV